MTDKLETYALHDNVYKRNNVYFIYNINAVFTVLKLHHQITMQRSYCNHKKNMFAIKLFIGHRNNEILETVRKTCEIAAFECFKNSLHTRFAHKYLIS